MPGKKRARSIMGSISEQDGIGIGVLPRIPRFMTTCQKWHKVPRLISRRVQMKRATFLLAISLLFVFANSICAGPKYGGTLRFAMRADPTTIDPHLGGDYATFFTKRLVCPSLVGVNVDNVNVPGLAESWGVSPDGLTITFHLRKGVLFHNGREMTAEDVKFSYDRVMDPKVGSPGRKQFRNIKSIDVVDRDTVKIHLGKKDGGFFVKLGEKYASIIPPESVDADGKVKHPVGAGPFKFVEWRPNNYIKLVRFDKYYEKGLPYLDEVMLKPIKEPAVRLAGLRAGDLDIAEDFPLSEIRKIEESKQFNVYTKPGAAISYLAFNLHKPPFNDVRVRRAVALAIDKGEISEAVFWGYALPTNQVYPPGSPWDLDVPPKYSKNIAKSEELLREAGYANGFKTTMIASDAIPHRLQISQVIQSQLKKVGIDIQLEMLDKATFYKKWASTDFAMLVGGAPVRPDAAYHFQECYHSQGSINNWYSDMSIPELDKLVDDSSRTMDYEIRKKLYTQAQQIIEDQLPFVNLLSIPRPTVWAKSVQGFEPNRRGQSAYQGGGITTTWLAE
jgi:peptide/nickel transport system substrate-binding protein